MSVTSQLEKAEEAIRQALINALAEGEDEYLSELFESLSSVRDLRMKITTPSASVIILKTSMTD